MTLDPRQLRAWQALGLGPVWSARPGRLKGELPVLASVTVAPAVDGRIEGSAFADRPVDDAPLAEVPSTGAPETDDPMVDAPLPGAPMIGTSMHALRGPAPDWATLRSAVETCQDCSLSRSRRNVVFGSGLTSARWLLVGEAPGREEDASGEPFVGQAGRLLDRMLAAAGLDRANDVFIANVLKCRPPNNRDPEPGEVEACSRHLAAQIGLLRPDIVVALGRFSAQTLLQTDATIGSLRGKVHRWQIAGRIVPLVCTYHPAYLLRTPADKRKVWEDLCLARDAFAGGPEAG